MKKNILLEYPQRKLSESVKGNNVHAYHIAKNFSKVFNVYSIKLKSDPFQIEKETGISIPSKIKLPYFIQYFLNFLSCFNKNIDLVYVRYEYSFLQQLGFIYSLLMKKIIIFEVGGIPWEEKKENFIQRIIIRPLKLIPLRRASLIITYSTELKRKLQQTMGDGDKIKVCPCGYDKTIFKKKSKEKLRKIYGFNTREKIVVFVGAIKKWQGLDILKGIEEGTKHNKTKILIIGDGDYLPKLKIILKNEKNVFFIGRLPQKKVVDYINMSDFCIAPFVSERKLSPIKIFEYSACGKVTLSSKIPDVLNLYIEGLEYFKTEDKKDFFKKFNYLINNPIVIRKREGCIIRSVKNYSWSKIISRIIKEINLF